MLAPGASPAAAIPSRPSITKQAHRGFVRHGVRESGAADMPADDRGPGPDALDRGCFQTLPFASVGAKGLIRCSRRLGTLRIFRTLRGCTSDRSIPVFFLRSHPAKVWVLRSAAPGVSSHHAGQRSLWRWQKSPCRTAGREPGRRTARAATETGDPSSCKHKKPHW